MIKFFSVIPAKAVESMSFLAEYLWIAGRSVATPGMTCISICWAKKNLIIEFWIAEIGD